MIVKDLEAEGFNNYGKVSLTFPERGIVLVTGPNGAGKSSIIEMVAFAGWGETLRGTPPFRAEEGCEASLHGAVEGKEVTALRTRKGRSTSLHWSQELMSPAHFPTTTKAQEALESLIGPYEVWQRTHVFSSGDAAHLTTATDKERKLFLEKMLGLGKFDGALSACREELKRAVTGLDALRGRAQMLQAELDQHLARKRDAEHTLNTLPPPSPVGGHAAVAANLQNMMRQTEASIRELRSRQAAAGSAQGAHQAEAAALKSRLSRMAAPGALCGECRQPLPTDLAKRAELEQALEVAIRAGKRVAEEKASELAGLGEQIQDDERVLARLREKLAAVSRESGAFEATERTRKAAQQALASAEAALMKAQEAAQEALLDLPRLSREVAVLTAAEAALGLRGARAGLFTKVLKGLEQACNFWLPQLAGEHLKMEFKPYSEKKSGGVSDAISIQVHGAGGGHGYEGASQGERRRLDLAVLLAFSGSGTLFMDEVFDTLYVDAIDALGKVLVELSKDRCIVVITHNEDLASKLPRVAHWHVNAGVVEKR